MRTARLALLIALLASVCGTGIYAALQSHVAAVAPLASYAPEGALLAVESPDFAGLLKRWTSSPEEKRWLASDNYADFSRSRLFSRLSEAQDQYAATAGLPADSRFVQQIAGGRSLFAWYDIGALKFLYITQMPAGEAGKTPLLALRDKFEQRKVGDATFYVRALGEPERTVAFAVRGDYLLLATSEDLIAGALQLMQQPADRTVQNEPWYAGASAAATSEPGDLRMTLNLAKIVPSPYFRSYWVQQNITAMKQYSAALNDLYIGSGSFREERVLLATNSGKVTASADLAPVLSFLPATTGAYRATAQPSTSAVLDQLEDKLLSRSPDNYRDQHVAPVADLSTPAAGDTSDLEDRIDEPLVVTQPRSADMGKLRDLISAAQPQAMLVFSMTDPPQPAESGEVFSPIHSAVVLSAPTAWGEPQLQQALIAALAPRLTVGDAGLAWQPHQRKHLSWSELAGMQGLAIAVRDKVCVLASDQATLLRMVESAESAPQSPKTAITVAGFDHRSERERFKRFSSLLDHSDRSNNSQRETQGNTPPFFSGNMLSLSDTFQDLDAETFTESATAENVRRQTVLYQWRR